MNCDQVFDVLTRGPFPTGHRSDRAVEAHLTHCRECQRLANALRPALELFQEAITGEEGRELPGYWGGMVDESEFHGSPGVVTHVRERLPESLNVRIDRGRRWVSQQTSGGGLRIAAAILIGVALAAVVWTAGVPAHRDEVQPNHLAARSTISPKIDQTNLPDQLLPTSLGSSSTTMTSLSRTLHLTETCLTGSPAQGTDGSHGQAKTAAYSVAELARLNCCTRCHHALASSSHPKATASVAKSCEICHR